MELKENHVIKIGKTCYSMDAHLELFLQFVVIRNRLPPSQLFHHLHLYTLHTQLHTQPRLMMIVMMTSLSTGSGSRSSEQLLPNVSIYVYSYLSTGV